MSISESTSLESLKNHFLISMPQLNETEFSHTVTYICEHNIDGAMGIVINQPLPLTLKDLLNELRFKNHFSNLNSPPVYAGGPVQVERGFILHDSPSNWESSAKIAEGIFMTTSKSIMKAIAEQKGPDNYIIALGYAGWSSGQLEREITENTWLTTPGSKDVIFFTPPEQRLQAASAMLGVDFSQLSSEIGHA